MQERRLFPRYSVDWPVRLGDSRGQMFDVMANNISLAGIGLEVARHTVVALAQAGGVLMPGDRLRLYFIGAQGAIGRADLGFECRVKEVRRLSREEYLVGLWFAALSEDEERSLRSLVDLAGG